MIIQQTKNFSKQKKKLHPNQINELDKVIKKIAENPKIGEQKKGDLHSIYVYKFKIHHHEILIAYSISKDSILLIGLGSHENFYRDLKRSIN